MLAMAEPVRADQLGGAVAVVEFNAEQSATHSEGGAPKDVIHHSQAIFEARVA
jgi:hypothetical protein